MNLSGELRAGTEALGLTLHQSQYDRLLEYLQLLEKWNQVYNLTAIQGLPRMLTYHLLDSLSLMSRLGDCHKVIDVGSGAGLPGIPLAIAMPNSLWIMIDSNARKTRFIRQAIAHCGIRNAQVVQSRVQDYHAPDRLDFVVSRAYAPLVEFCDSVAHLLEPGTRMITMKTGLSQQEVQQLDTNRFAFEEETIKVPGISETRSLVTISSL
ncbi:MAG: 16S rRNA (guanine(527)-N(7))-methyltransferase RsmG [Gammaproteobacteria bacterium]|nr:16S rRNA (guanine(527)-N(7))-methyltransferase RsmG [Gammaproteobacteria bacterium]